MLFSFLAVVREGQIVPLENIQLPENARVLVTILPDEETEFWEFAGEMALKTAWNNEADEVYAVLMEKEQE